MVAEMPGAVPVSWQDVERVSAERDEGDDALPTPGDACARIRAEAERAYGPGHIATLLWIDARCQAAGMHALDPWHVENQRAYYESGKPVDVEGIGLRGAKSVTKCRALVNDAIFQRRDIDPGTVGVIPIMSADRTEATDRFYTLRKILGACGVRSTREEDAGDYRGLGINTEFTPSTLPSGGGVIKTVDSQGHPIEFRVYPARINGAVGYTAIAGLCDEVDLWPVDLGVSTEDVAQRKALGRANPADVVLDRLLERFTTTLASAHLYIVSATYRGRDSAHVRKLQEGDTPIQRVARLGVLGAQRDEEARRRLAASICSDDPRLLAPADPMSTEIPAWVTNPAAPIESCYALSRGRLGAMFGRYGARPDEAQGASPFAGVPFAFTSDSAFADVVIALAPPEGDGPWAAVVAAWGPSGVAVCEDMTGRTFAEIVDRATATRPPVSVFVAQKDHAKHTRAMLATVQAPWVPPVAEVDVYDARTLRTGPLLTRYLAGRIRHARGLDALEQRLRAFDPERRDPVVEALACAVERLASCYDFAGEKWTGQVTPQPRGAMMGVR
jgi:hypothetical protein